PGTGGVAVASLPSPPMRPCDDMATHDAAEGGQQAHGDSPAPVPPSPSHTKVRRRLHSNNRNTGSGNGDQASDDIYPLTTVDRYGKHDNSEDYLHDSNNMHGQWSDSQVPPRGGGRGHTTTNTNFQGASPPLPKMDFLISRVYPSTDEQKIRECLYFHGIIDFDLFQVSHVNSQFKSYKLSVKLPDKDIVLSPDMWPDGVCVQRLGEDGSRGYNSTYSNYSYYQFIMKGENKVISVISYNCEHADDVKLPFFHELFDICDFLLIQDYAMFQSKLPWLNAVDSDVGVHGVSAMDENKLLGGRPHGGAVILWRGSIGGRVTPVLWDSKIFCAVIYNNGDSKLLIVCVHMPRDDSNPDANGVEYDNDILNEICSLISSVDVDSLCIGGDFNTDCVKQYISNRYTKKVLLLILICFVAVQVMFLVLYTLT
ncbi:unnamed protein product, partial [Meganyctiphanes norvegica]